MMKKLCSDWVYWFQWFAVITMLLDHVSRFLIPELWGLSFIHDSIGRFAFPFFAAMIAWHCLFNSRSLFNYSQRLFIIGFISCVPYFLVVGFRFNILFTLSFSLVFIYLFNCNLYKVKNIILFVLSFYILFNYSLFFEYGFFGILLVPAFYLLFRSFSVPFFLFFTIPILLYVVYSLNPSFLSILFALVGSLIVVYITTLHSSISPGLRIPRVVWLSFYPVHLSVIYLLS